MNSRLHRRSTFLGASVAILMLSLGGLTACSSDSTENTPSTTIAVKNGVLRSTTTNVPQTIAVCQGGGKNCNKPKRNP